MFLCKPAKVFVEAVVHYCHGRTFVVTPFVEGLWCKAVLRASVQQLPVLDLVLVPLEEAFQLLLVLIGHYLRVRADALESFDPVLLLFEFAFFLLSPDSILLSLPLVLLLLPPSVLLGLPLGLAREQVLDSLESPLMITALATEIGVGVTEIGVGVLVYLVPEGLHGRQLRHGLAGACYFLYLTKESVF